MPSAPARRPALRSRTPHASQADSSVYTPRPKVLQFRRMRLLGGDAGVSQTIRYMRELCEGGEGSGNPWVRFAAVRMVRNSRNRDARGELAAVLGWVKRNIAFRGERDETVQSPLVTLQLRAGDCDDHSTLICALLKSLGYEARFVTVAADGGSNAYSHVLPEVRDPRTGRWVSLESTVEEAWPGWKPPAGTVHRRAEWESGNQIMVPNTQWPLSAWPLSASRDRGPSVSRSLYRGRASGMGRLAAIASPQVPLSATQLPYPPRGGCSGTSSPGGTQIASSSLMAAAPLTGPLAPFVAIGGMITGLFGGAHAAAVKKESQILCTAVPAANQALQQISSQVQSGDITPDQGAQLLDQLTQQFTQALAPLKQQSGCGPGLAVGQTCPKGSCNGGCLYKAWLGTIVADLKRQFAAMPKSSGFSIGAGKTFAGIPLWGWLAGAVALGMAVL